MSCHTSSSVVSASLCLDHVFGAQITAAPFLLQGMMYPFSWREQLFITVMRRSISHHLTHQRLAPHYQPSFTSLRDQQWQRKFRQCDKAPPVTDTDKSLNWTCLSNNWLGSLSNPAWLMLICLLFLFLPFVRSLSLSHFPLPHPTRQV